MYQNIIALDVSEWSFEQAAEFIKNFANLIYSGQGTTSKWGKALPVKESDGLKVLLGVSSDWLTLDRQRIIESVYAYTFKVDFKHRPEIWTDAPNWHFENPNAVNVQVDSLGSKLDINYMENLGLRMAVWEKEIFVSKVSSVFPKDSDNLQYRALISLGVFGFPKPYQFFV